MFFCLFAHQSNPRFGGGFPIGYETGVNLPKAILQWLKGENCWRWGEVLKEEPVLICKARLCCTSCEAQPNFKKQLNMKKVKNVQGHYTVPAGYSSWLNYWERNMTKTAVVCQKNGCKKSEDLKGGHVHFVGDEETVYLVPICHEHNHYTFTDEYLVPEDMLLEVPKEDLKRAILEEWLEEIKKNQKEK